MIFQNSNPNPKLAIHIISHAGDFYWCAVDWKKNSNFTMKCIRWEKPRSDWKLNMDGSFLGNPGLAGGGGVIRDDTSNWVVGFSRRIGITLSFEAELWALRDGLTICVDRNFQAIEVEMDAKTTINFLQKTNQTNPIISPLLDDCRSWLLRSSGFNSVIATERLIDALTFLQERVQHRMKIFAFFTIPCGVTSYFKPWLGWAVFKYALPYWVFACVVSLILSPLPKKKKKNNSPPDNSLTAGIPCEYQLKDYQSNLCQKNNFSSIYM